MIALFFDTETTGFPNPANPPQIVQIGAILQDCDTKRVIGEINLIVKPGVEIPQACIDVHGITNDLAAKHGVKPGIADNMFAILASQADVLVAHNIKFDREVIAGAWSVSPAILQTKEQYCTMVNATELVGIPKSHGGGYKYPRLMETHMHLFGREFEGAHDAMADVRACRDVYFEMQKVLEKPAV